MEGQRRQRRSTIYTVATDAGVSIATVSRILNGKFRGSDEVRSRVEAAMVRLGYRPSPFARRLSGQKSSTRMIGVLAPFFTDPFFVEVLRGIYKRLHNGREYHMVLYDVDSREMKKAVLSKLAHDELLDGLLVVNMHTNTQEYGAIARRIPVVYVAAETDFADFVAVDHYKGIALGLEHVHALGHRAVAYINNEKAIYESRIRERAFLETAQRLGLTTRLDYRSTDHRAGYMGARNMIENNPEITCLFYYSDLMAYGGLDYLNENSLRDRVSIIGFDGFERTFQSALTSVVQPMEKMGEVGADILIGKVEGRSLQRQAIVLDPWLFKGKTCVGRRDEQRSLGAQAAVAQT